MFNEDTAVIIPSRIGSVRLERKPLQLIEGRTMIEYVVTAAIASNVGPVFVATDSIEIAERARFAGADSVLVTEDVDSGTDRVWRALCKIAPNEGYKYVINLQGDLPLVNPDIISSIAYDLKNSKADIVTPVTLEAASQENDLSKVKVVMTNELKALYFSRNMIPSGASSFWHHIGIYGFKREALSRFVDLPKSSLELSENLEQLRALEFGMNIELCKINEPVFSVDTEFDLERVRQIAKK